jgi:hypothetical protein
MDISSVKNLRELVMKQAIDRSLVPGPELPEEFFPDSSIERKIFETQEELLRLKAMSEEERVIATEQYNASMTEGVEAENAKREAALEKIAPLLESLERWHPSSDCMLVIRGYVSDSLRADFFANIGSIRLPDPLTPTEWYEGCMTGAKLRLDILRGEWEEELKRTRSRNKLLRDLKEDIDKIC